MKKVLIVLVVLSLPLSLLVGLGIEYRIHRQSSDVHSQILESVRMNELDASASTLGNPANPQARIELYSVWQHFFHGLQSIGMAWTLAVGMAYLLLMGVVLGWFGSGLRNKGKGIEPVAAPSRAELKAGLKLAQKLGGDFDPAIAEEYEGPDPYELLNVNVNDPFNEMEQRYIDRIIGLGSTRLQSLPEELRKEAERLISETAAAWNEIQRRKTGLQL